MASVEQRGPGSWRIGVRTSVEDGRKWIRRTVTFPQDMPLAEQRARAQIAAAQLELEIAQGVTGRDRLTTLGEFAEIWMAQHVIPNCKPTTAKTYRCFLDARILPELGAIQLADLTPLRLTEFINALRTSTARTTAIDPQQRVRVSDRSVPLSPPKTLSDSTVKHIYDTLRDMLSMAVLWEYISKNPMDRVIAPKVPKRRARFLDDRQAVHLLRCLAQEESLPMRCAVLLALLCGLRLGEVGALTLDDVDWQECTISIHQSLHYAPGLGSYLGEPKTEAGYRIIDLPAGMMALLDQTRQYHEDSARILGDRWRGCGRIVSAWDGTPLHHDTPSKWFRRFADRNGFAGVRFHDLRHTHATLLFANNLDAVAIASRLGHEDASTTLRIYAHAIRQRDQLAAAAMQRLLDRSTDPDPS